MVRVMMQQRVAALLSLMMIAVVGCGEQATGPEDQTSGSAATDSAKSTEQPPAQTLREITLEVTGMN